MEQVTLSVEQFNELKNQIKAEIEADKKVSGWNKPVINVQRKYHEQIIKIGYSCVWNTVRNMTAILMGYKRSMDIPIERYEEAGKIAETLLLKVLEAFGGKA